MRVYAPRSAYITVSQYLLNRFKRRALLQHLAGTVMTKIMR